MHLDDNIIASIREQSLQLEKDRKQSSIALEQIIKNGWFKLFVPKELGGHMAPLPEALRIFEYASWIDGSFGWAVTIGAGGGFFVPFMQPDTAKQLFSDPHAVVAGSGAPAGKALETEGGYIINGSWKYCSGSSYATVFTANCVIQSEASPEPEPDQPLIRAFAFLPEQVEIVPDWEAFGLKGTDSHSIKVSNQFIPADRMFNLLDMQAYKEEPLYRYPFLPFAQASFAAVALGISRHFLEQAAEMTSGGKDALSTARYEAVMSRYAAANDRLNSNAHSFYEGVQASWEAVKQGGLTQEAESGVSKLCQRTARIALACASELFPYLGLAACMEHTPINQVWRDLQTACHHSLLVDHEADLASTLI